MRILKHLIAISASFNQALAFTSLCGTVGTGVTSQRPQALFRAALRSHSGHGYDESSVLQTKSTVATRKSFVEFVGITIASSLAMTPLPVSASGGATAGGAYLLSAKQRYNQRVLSGVKSFLGLDARDLDQVDKFFTTPDEGGWEDLSAAGYLLANAFRTSSTKAPDNLPSVKKWKAFAKDVDLLKRALAKKDGEKVFAAYKIAEEKLDAYLDEVELTSLAR